MTHSICHSALDDPCLLRRQSLSSSKSRPVLPPGLPHLRQVIWIRPHLGPGRKGDVLDLYELTLCILGSRQRFTERAGNDSGRWATSQG